MRSRVLRIVAAVGILIGFLLISGLIYLYIVATVHPPKPPKSQARALQRTRTGPDQYVLGNNWFRKSETGLFELYVEGTPYDRGLANGKLTAELVQYQEKVFNDQIHLLVPSSAWLNVLKYFVGWFNRDLDSSVPEEYRQEILGVSEAASHDYDHIAPPYQRLLNYHAAHDIGHALQNMSLVGCTSFAAWGTKSSDNSLVVARTFDFYVGDEFARDKIVAFYKPSEGHRFMMVTFGGMTGVLSGMNDAGLTVTINAAKSDIPSASATPVSLVAREILQYAATIDEAYAIANGRKMFVSESFLIGSAKDGIAAIIEKTPDQMDRVVPPDNFVICTNHFQGSKLSKTELNIAHMETSASPHRWKRVEELLTNVDKVSVSNAIQILRDRQGLQGQDIGLGNEKAINQLIAHHAVVFQPGQLRVWVSTAPWQLGRFVCYDLNKVFDLRPSDIEHEIYEKDLTVPADSFLLTKEYADYTRFAPYRFPYLPRKGMPVDSLVAWNPNSYLPYMLAGDAYFAEEKRDRALNYYKRGLTKDVATAQERAHMEERLKQCEQQP